MTPDEFAARCPRLWHVGPLNSWARISRTGFRTAEQLIGDASIDEDARRKLLTERRCESVVLPLDGDEVRLRDQGPLLKRRDLDPILGDGMTTADWIRLLNARVYFFAEMRSVEQLLGKYVAKDGAQELLTVSTWHLVQTAARRIEVSAQNTGAIAPKGGVQKTRDTFVSLALFPSKRPREVTVLGGIDDATIVKRAVRHYSDGRAETLFPPGIAERDVR